MPSADDIGAGCALLSLSWVTLATYLLALVAVVRVYKTTKNAFYLLLFALGVSDSAMLSLFAFYSTTATFLQMSPLGRTFDALFCGTVCNVTYFSSLALLVNIALNRYFAVCRNEASPKVYDKSKIALSIGICYSIGAASAVAQLTPCCSLRYFEDDYAWSYDMTLAGNAAFVWYDRFMNTTTFLCLVTTYSLICRRVRMLRKATHPSTSGSKPEAAQSRNRQRTQVRLAVQTGLVSGLMIVLGLGFTIIPLVTSNKWWNLFGSLLYISAIGVHPFVYIAFNGQIRAQVLGIILCKPVTNGHVQTIKLCQQQAPIRLANGRRPSADR